MLGLRVCAQLETYEFRFLVGMRQTNIYVPHGSDSNSVRVRVMENNEVAKQTRNKQQLKLIHYIRSPQCADRMLSYERMEYSMNEINRGKKETHI